MGSKLSLKDYINGVRSYLKKEEISASYLHEEFSGSGFHETFTSPSTGIEFVLIPAGGFDLILPEKEKGKDKDKDKGKDNSGLKSQAYKVTIRNPFYASKSQVTQKQWKKIMGNNPSHFKGEDLPVEMISWGEVQKFIRKLNEKESTDKYRLPLEVEWEYACRAGTQTKYFFGDEESKLKEYAWYNENSGSKTHPIGQKKPNSWGLYDMHGNVWEWVQDRWSENSNSVYSLSSGGVLEDMDNSARVSRGGSWFCNTELCSSASRFKREPQSHFSNLGFRLLREF